MANNIQIGTAGELLDGGKKKVTVQGEEIMLARAGSDYYAIANRCPHAGGDLSMGKLEGTVVTCPRHGSQFDIRNGQVVRWLKGSGVLSSIGKAIKSPLPVKTYKVKVEGEKIFIEV